MRTIHILAARLPRGRWFWLRTIFDNENGHAVEGEDPVMKRLVTLLILVAACAVMTGCNQCNTRRGGCESCSSRGLLGRGGHAQCRGCGAGGLLAGGLCHSCAKRGGGVEQGGGPPMAQYAYPYYTVRGPRDFLVDNPPSIGP
jgi:hypothetical protein